MSDSIDPDDLVWLDRYAKVIAHDVSAGPRPLVRFNVYLAGQVISSLATLDEAKAEAEAALRGEAKRLDIEPLAFEWIEIEPGYIKATVAKWKPTD